MVLEQLYNVEWLEKKPYASFLLGLAYSVFGLFFAVLAFKDDPALVAVAVTSILLLPTLYELTTKEEAILREETDHSVWHLVADNKEFVKIYAYLFMGILLSFAFFSIALPNLAAGHLFKQQLEVRYGTGRAIFTTGLFLDIVSNNIRVMLLAFLISLIAGNGGIFLITWNASVWGTIFGNLAKTAATAIAGNPYIVFGLVFISVLPHTLMEALGYIFGALSGTVISRGLIVEKWGTEQFRRILMHGLILLAIAAGIIILAGLVETLVLGNFETYRKIITLSFT